MKITDSAAFNTKSFWYWCVIIKINPPATFQWVSKAVPKICVEARMSFTLWPLIEAIIKILDFETFDVIGMGHEHFWTSGTDQAEEGKFFWMSTGKPVTYENWNAGEPNNFQ